MDDGFLHERDYEWHEEVTVFLVPVKAYHDTVDDQDVYKTVRWMTDC